MNRNHRTLRAGRIGAAGARYIAMAAIVALFGVIPGDPASAQQRSDSVTVPGFWDPNRRPERPDLSRLNAIRFLTDCRIFAWPFEEARKLVAR
jgi:hypothetical protein